ncbi:hypothetical protein J3B02_004108, partial [Coemansia erecta]
MSLFGRERVAATLNSVLAQHSRGLETTIYADDAMLRIVNSSVQGGLSGLLLRNNRVNARNIRRLGEAEEAPGMLGLADGQHMLFLFGDVSWMDAETWKIMETVLSKNETIDSCTLCVAVPELLWNESLALASNVKGGLKAPVTEASVCAMLQRLAGSRKIDCSVHVHGMAAMALPGNYFALPWDATGSTTGLARQSEWVDAERAALGLATLVHELRLDARFYSLGSGAARRVARRGAAMPRVSPTGQLATVVVLDRAFDMAAVVRHGGNVLDDLLRAMESTGATQELLLAKLCQSAEIGDKLAGLQDRRRAEGLVAQSESLKQMWDEVQEVAANCRWRETQAAEKTLALVLASENDADAAWDHVLTAIPPLAQEMIPDPATHTGSMNDVLRILVANTPAPGMLVMAASLLSYRRLGFPQTQRALAIRRLVSDYASVAGYSISDSNDAAATNGGSDAWRWASWLVERAAVLAEGSRDHQPGLNIDFEIESSFMPLFPRIAADIASGRQVKCAQLELAERGGATGTAASLLKGLG